MTINQRLFEEMEKRKLKSSDLAEELNINKSVISAWKKRGSNPPAEHIVNICKFLDMSLEEFLGCESEFTYKEKEIIRAYRQADQEHKRAAELILNVKTEQESSISRTG